MLLATRKQEVKYRMLVVKGCLGQPVTIQRETRTRACWLLLLRTDEHMGQLCFAQGAAICFQMSAKPADLFYSIGTVTSEICLKPRGQGGMKF